MNQDDAWEPIILVLGAMALLVFGLPVFLPRLVDAAVAQLLQLSLVVPAAQAVLRIPGTAIGLDAPRLLIIAGGVLLLAAVARMGMTRRDQQN